MRNTYSQLEARRQGAVQELAGMISTGYPTTEFVIKPGIDDPKATHITAVVDVDDPDEVMDLVIDRVVAGCRAAASDHTDRAGTGTVSGGRAHAE